MKKGRSSMSWALILAAITGLTNSSYAAEFLVTNPTQFQNALNTAETNNQSDTINVAAATYNITAPLTYNPSGAENYPLTIIGLGRDSSILEGGDANQIMYIRIYDLSNDSNAHITVKNLTFQNGRIADDAIGSGGGLFVLADLADITVENSRFLNNKAKYYGGGANVRTNNGTATLTNNIFSDNAVTAGGPGYVAYSGGGLSAGSYYGAVNITNSTFSNNSVSISSGSTEGGGVKAFTSNGTVTLTNNIFGNNSSSWGGGMSLNTFTGTVTLTNNTFSNNTGSLGGGLYLELNNNSATANIYNNIIWGNVAGSGGDLYIMDDREWDYTGSTVNLYNNNYKGFYIEDGDNLSQGNNINADPLFTSDYHIRSGSLCINIGDNGAPSLPASDFDGGPRIVDYIVDIGADEYPEPVFPWELFFPAFIKRLNR